MRICCAPGCRSRYLKQASKSDDKRHLFSPPKDAARLKVWENAIPGKTFTLTSKHYLCDLHFQPDDINRHYSHIINGQTILIDRGQWTLKKDAVPCLFPNGPEHPSKPTAKSSKRKALAQAAPTSVTPDVTITDEPEADDEDSSRTDTRTNVSDICSEISGTRSPFEGWSLQRTPDDHVIFYKLVEKQGVVSVTRAVTLRKNLPLVVSVGGKLVPEASYRSRSTTRPCISTLEELGVFLDYIDSLKVCAGCPLELFQTVTTSVTAVGNGDMWRRKTCMVLSEQTTCRGCVLTRKVFREREKEDALQNRQPPNGSLVCM
uniref:THAP-type domain-containing protein n=1 Tax=Ixodes ricinus TaxID=34613 RepID=A0A0K8RML9_IXORI